jgi:hypothetical protein
MPARTADERSVKCESLALKVRVYVSEASVQGRSTQGALFGLSQYAAELAEQSDSTTLAALGREVDGWLREVHEPSEALLLVARMRTGGVRECDLPVLASAKRLKAIATRGSVRSWSEAKLVQSVLANAELAKVLGPRSVELRTALGKWCMGRACG